VINFPDTCLRGLRKPEWLDENIIQTPAFVPDHRTAQTRVDGGQETSINWEDDEQVEKFTLSNDNGKYGAARISTVLIQSTSDEAKMVKNPLFYERKRLDGNDYHGNIVFKARLKNHTVKMLAAALALKSEFVPPHRPRLF
jgi:hypothetical protein